MLLADRYRIESVLASGGEGSVSLAVDEQLGRKVAIKRLHPDSSVDPENAFQTILQESQALSALNSPNIVSVYDVSRHEGEPFVVMEFLEGQTLADVVSRAPLTLDDFISVADQALEALIAAHSVGIVHRDLKPENIMITFWPSGRFQAKILDFGLSAHIGQELAAEPNSLLGSIYFMAPEQFKNAAVDARTDLYALGCVFYYALTGSPPFTGDNAAQIMASHLQGRVEELFEQRIDTDPRICDWVMELIQTRPDDRPLTARDALTDLQEIQKVPLAQLLAAEENAANEEVSKTVIRETDQQTKILIGIGIGLVTLLLIGLIWLAM